MAFERADRAIDFRARPVSAKVVIAGGFGVGKTTFVGAISEIRPLRTEAAMTAVSVGIDDTTHIPGKTTTTVAMDFGKITVESGLVLYLFGTPGQDRFGFMWDDVTEGSLGALVLVDTRRIEDCYAAVDFFEDRGVPFVVAVNQFEEAPRHPIEEVRYALNLDRQVPLVYCDARDPSEVRDALVSLLDHILARLTESAAARPLARRLDAGTAARARQAIERERTLN